MAETEGMAGPALTCFPAREAFAASPSSPRVCELALSCRPSTLLPPAGHAGWCTTSGNGEGGLICEEARQAILCLAEPHRQRMPRPARKPGNSYKFNKICLINYSSSPRAWFAAPRSKSWAKLGGRCWREVV